MSGTGSVLLDTTAVIAHLRQESGLTRQFGDKGLYLPVIALGELFYGAYRSRVREKVVAQIQDFLQLCAVLLPARSRRSNTGRSRPN